MIEPVDIRSIDTEYFYIIEAKGYLEVLHSRVTGHDWTLLERIDNGHRTFLISHRHRPGMSFHKQTNRSSIKACCDYIKEHDAFHLERERQKKARRLERRF